MSYLVSINIFFLFLLVNFSVLGNSTCGSVKCYVLFLLLFLFFSFLFYNVNLIVELFRSIVFRTLFLLLFWLSLSLFYSDWIDASWNDFSKIVLFIFGGFSFFLFSFYIKLDYFFYIFSFTSFFQLIVMISVLFNYGMENLGVLFATGQAFSGSPIFSNYIQQVFDGSVIGNSQNIYSSFIASFFFLFLVFRVLSKKTIFSNFVFYFSFISYSLIFIFSLSKTSFSIFFGLSFFYILYFYPLKGFLFICFLAFIFVFSGVFTLIYNRFSSMFDSSSGDVTMSSREELWQIAFNIIEEYPWIGMGFRVSNDLFISNSVDGVNNPHNIILRLWVDGGIIAVVLYLLMIIYMFYQLINVKANKSNSIFFVKWFSFFYFLLFFLRNMFAFQMTEFDFFLVVPLMYYVFYRHANSFYVLEQVNKRIN